MEEVLWANLKVTWKLNWDHVDHFFSLGKCVGHKDLGHWDRESRNKEIDKVLEFGHFSPFLTYKQICTSNLFFNSYKARH